ncbi:D-glycerate dehydrogenase [Patescibacteria group bacterium]|nr:D-glycerate dehydrogenase [Patescibacteria group bacterium]
MPSQPKVVVTRPIHEAGLKMLQSRYAVTVHADTIMTPTQLRTFVKGADAVVTLLTDAVDDTMMEAAGSQLKVIAQYAVGFDNIDLEAAKQRGIIVCNTPGAISAPAVAEHAVTLMFATARHLLPADTFMRHGRYKHWDPNLFLGRDLVGKTVGILGSGQIGSQFARICHNGLRMRVLYYDICRNEAIEKDLGATKVSLEQLLVTSDVVSIHLPLNRETRHLLGKEEFRLMKPTAVLINTGRGPIINENALVKALADKELYAAGLDVFEFEPELAAGLAKLENVVVTPHIGSATELTRQGMAESVARNIHAVLSGETPTNVVSK